MRKCFWTEAKTKTEIKSNQIKWNEMNVQNCGKSNACRKWKTKCADACNSFCFRSGFHCCCFSCCCCCCWLSAGQQSINDRRSAQAPPIAQSFVQQPQATNNNSHKCNNNNLLDPILTCMLFLLLFLSLLFFIWLQTFSQIFGKLQKIQIDKWRKSFCW